MAPVTWDSRSLYCSGVGVTTPEIRSAAASISTADSGDTWGLWLSSADTGQWCHVAFSPRNSVDACQHEHRDLAVRLALVLGIVGPRRHRAFPPRGLLVAEHLMGLEKAAPSCSSTRGLALTL